MGGLFSPSVLKYGALVGGAWAVRRYVRQRSASDLHQRVVMITGGSRGLGFAMAREFADEGCRLVLLARNEEQLELARDKVHGTDVMIRACDVRDKAQVQEAVREATDRFGRIDILVNNASTITTGPIEVQTEDDFRAAMDTMFWGTYHPTMAVLPQMMDRNEGRILNITSIGGVVAAPHLLPYTAAKFAVVGFSQGLHNELRSRGIKVTTVIPGFMRTGSPKNAIFKGKHREEYRWFSLGAALPFTSNTARSAARQIVDTARHGDATLMITPYVKVAMVANALSPGLMSVFMRIFAQVLPTAGGIGTEGRLGRDSEGAISSSFATVLGQRAAREYQHLEV